MTTFSPQQIYDQAAQHHSAGRLREAESLYRQILAQDANQPDALCGLGLIAYQSRALDQARSIWRHVLTIYPNHGETWFWQAHAQLTGGDVHQAISSLRRACELMPNPAKAFAQLGHALSTIAKHDEAVAAATRAVELEPDSSPMHANLGRILHLARRLDHAAESIRRAIELEPTEPRHHIALAAAYDDLDRVEESIASAEEAVRLGVKSADLFSNVSSMQRRRRDYRAAIEYADRAIQLMPGHAAAHGSRGLALLSLGNYADGFAEYEWRWRCANFTTAPREFARPMWDASDPMGRTILVHPEQGFGDTIQFARFVPLLVDRGAKVIVECNAQLRSIFQSLRGVMRVIPTGIHPPDFDMHAPMMSLPRALGVRSIETIPADVPYLCPDDARLETWRARVAGAGFKVGLIWWGNARPDPNRSCPLSAFAPLARAHNISFFGLQKGEVPREASNAPDGMTITELSNDLRDFADTAAAMMHLDLIITIDTAAAHLAGALARPVWTLLPWAPDWRWMLDRHDSPWYPTMRLFRQQKKGDWTDVIEQVAVELQRVVTRSQQ